MAQADGFQIETIIHPSVYYFDDMTPLGIVFINMLSCRSMIRKKKMEIDQESKTLFWNEGYSRRVNTERSKTRVLVCGTLGIGKSSIINLILESALVGRPIVGVNNRMLTTN